MVKHAGFDFLFKVRVEWKDAYSAKYGALKQLVSPAVELMFKTLSEREDVRPRTYIFYLFVLYHKNFKSLLLK